MENYDFAYAFTKVSEGGFVNDPRDPGGATNHGVSLRYLRGLPQYVINDRDLDKDRNGRLEVEDIRLLTKDDAKNLFKFSFWNETRCDDLPKRIATAMFDFAVNAGPSRAIKELQRACNVHVNHIVVPLRVDGAFGPKTFSRVQSVLMQLKGEERLLAAFLDNRSHFYERLIRSNPKLVCYRRGWDNRVNALRKYLKSA